MLNTWLGFQNQSYGFVNVVAVKDVNMSELNLLEIYLGKNILEYAHQCFKNRRENVGEYLRSCFCPPPALAMELYRKSSLTGVSHGPGSSGVILPLQSDTSYYTRFAESLQQIEGSLTHEELSWAHYQMTKYAGQISVFCAKSPRERIDFVKKGYVRKYVFHSYPLSFTSILY